LLEGGQKKKTFPLLAALGVFSIEKVALGVYRKNSLDGFLSGQVDKKFMDNNCNRIWFSILRHTFLYVVHYRNPWETGKNCLFEANEFTIYIRPEFTIY